MKVALIGDMHANLPALEAVLEHVRQHGAEAIWNIGDFVGYGPFPEEVVNLLRSQPVVSIVGNYDTAVVKFGKGAKKKKHPAKAFAHQWAYEHLSKESLRYLESLPEQIRLEVEDRRVLLTHGSPQSPDEHLTPDTPQERLGDLAEMAQADIVICGHSHQPFVRRADGVWFINTGSVGRPDDGDPRACYAMMEITQRKLQVRHYRIDYDLQRTVDAMRKNHLPEAFIQMIVQGRALDEVEQKQPQRQGEGETRREKHTTKGKTDVTQTQTIKHKDNEKRQRRGSLADDNAPMDIRKDEPEDPRLGSVLQLARVCNYEQGHTHQVTRLALKLFDDLQSLHKLDEQERFWLECGALLHDIGWIEGQKGHHKTALRIILDSPLLPFNGRERQIIGSIARYHRRAAPKKKHVPYGELGPDDRDVVRILSAILRVADSLDVWHEDRVKDVSAKVLPDEIVVHCKAAKPLDEERDQVRNKGALFEEVFKRKLEVQWHRA